MGCWGFTQLQEGVDDSAVVRALRKIRCSLEAFPGCGDCFSCQHPLRSRINSRSDRGDIVSRLLTHMQNWRTIVRGPIVNTRRSIGVAGHKCGRASQGLPVLHTATGAGDSAASGGAL